MQHLELGLLGLLHHVLHHRLAALAPRVEVHHLAQQAEVRLVRDQAEHDEVRVRAVHAVPRVRVVARALPHLADELHNLVLAFAGDIGAGVDDGEVAPRRVLLKLLVDEILRCSPMRCMNVVPGVMQFESKASLSSRSSPRARASSSASMRSRAEAKRRERCWFIFARARRRPAPCIRSFWGARLLDQRSMYLNIESTTSFSGSVRDAPSSFGCATVEDAVQVKVHAIELWRSVKSGDTIVFGYRSESHR